MSFLRILPAQVCLLLLAALFMRLGFPLIMIVPLTLMLMGALLVPWSEVRAVMTVVTGLCALLWGFMTYLRVEERLAYGEPWSRLAGILAGVALFNAWSAWLLWRSRKTIRQSSEVQAMGQTFTEPQAN
jgi:type VI protein secretion system component VasK